MRKRTFFKHAAFFAICCGLLPLLKSCTEPQKGNTTVDPVVDPLEKRYTPIFKGTSTFLDEKEKDLTLYSTGLDGIYFIPYFFKGNDGELDFHWDRETNKIEVYQSYTGIFDSALYPVYILSQKTYEAAMGKDARESYYDPKSNTFTFYVLLELTDGNGGVIRNPTILTFNVTEVL